MKTLYADNDAQYSKSQVNVDVRMLEWAGIYWLIESAINLPRSLFLIIILYMDSLLKPLNSKKASFGRHETFALRYAWLTKGFQAFEKNNSIFSSDEATIELGVGKNMVNAIKYWLRASSMLLDIALVGLKP